MKLVLKSLKNQLFEVDINSLDDTIAELKKALGTKFGYDTTCLKLLHKGLVLQDSKKLSEYSILETDNIVIMNIKAKPILNVEETKIEENNVSESVTKKIKDYSTEIASLMDLGFTFERSKNVIKRTKGDLAMATEFLFNGLDLEDNLETLEGTLPKENVFQSIASICKIAGYNKPKYVKNILKGLEHSNPDVALAIKNNKEDFDNLINQPITQEDVNIYKMFTGKTFNQNLTTNVNNVMSHLNQVSNNPVNTNFSSESLYNNAINNNSSLKQKYNLSDSDYTAVLRLKDLGFSLIECIETFIACDKNETIAANFLVDSKFKDDMNIDCNYIVF